MIKNCSDFDSYFKELVQLCKKDGLHREQMEKLLDVLYENCDKFDLSQPEYRKMVLAYSDTHASDVAKDTLKNFQESTENISDITKLNIEQVERIILDEELDLSNLKNKVDSFHTEIFGELEKANKKIENLQQEIHSLEKEVNLDHLTKVFNRKTLIEDINHLIEVAQSKENTFSIVILDLDDFKLINDRHGHLAGDKVLIYVAKLLKAMVKTGAKVYRFGGEEFIIVMNEAFVDEAKVMAHKAVEAVGKNKLKFKSEIITITASVGVTQYREGDDYETLFARADKAMYEAKANGKNRVELR